MLTLWSAAAGCNNRMPMCIGSFSLHSKWIGLSKRYPNSSVLRRDVESDRLIGNSLLWCLLFGVGLFYHTAFASCLTVINRGKIITECLLGYWFIQESKQTLKLIILSICETTYYRKHMKRTISWPTFSFLLHFLTPSSPDEPMDAALIARLLKSRVLHPLL